MGGVPCEAAALLRNDIAGHWFFENTSLQPTESRGFVATQRGALFIQRSKWPWRVTETGLDISRYGIYTWSRAMSWNMACMSV